MEDTYHRVLVVHPSYQSEQVEVTDHNGVTTPGTSGRPDSSLEEGPGVVSEVGVSMGTLGGVGKCSTRFPLGP